MATSKRPHHRSSVAHDDADDDFKEQCSIFTSAVDKLIQRATALIDNSDFFDSGLQESLRRVRRSGDMQSAKRHKIGLLGASGVGKSSLFNAIIHQKDLSKTVSDNSACLSERELIVVVCWLPGLHQRNLGGDWSKFRPGDQISRGNLLLHGRRDS